MLHNFTRTVALAISGFPASTARNVIASAIANRFLSLKVTALQFVGNIARVSFADTASKELILRMESVYVGDIACPVRGGGPRPQKVFIHNYPFEARLDSLSLVLKRFGDVNDISHMKDIFDGVRVVTMIRDKPIPRNLDVDGFHVKVSYYGQSVECDICKNHGHVARDCPLKGKCLWYLKRKIDNGSTSFVDAYKNALVNLGKLDLEAANGARVRSRVQWAEEGETSSKYFFRLEKKNKAERWISALKDEDGIIHSDVDGISHVLSSFHSSLFSSEDTVPSAQAVLLNNLETSLSPEQSGLCDGPLSLRSAIPPC